MSIFDTTPLANLSRSSFNLSHEVKSSFNYGGLYPILRHLCLPGDKISASLQSFIRTVPLISPVMHRNDIKVDCFFVPWRLIWVDYDSFCTCADSTLKLPKFFINGLTSTTVTDSLYDSFLGVGSLGDHLGFASIPKSFFTSTAITKYASRKVNALPFRAYALIYDYYYRNKALEDSILDDTNVIGVMNGSGNYDISVLIQKYFSIMNRSWRRDQFTSALPSPTGGNAVLLPESDLSVAEDGNFKFSNPGTASHNLGIKGTNDATNKGAAYDVDTGNIQKYSSGLKVTKSNSPTIDDFRFAEVLDEYEQAAARVNAQQTGGFKEWLLGIWRTLSPDARLDRPEYLGGYRGPIQISEVPQTSSATSTSPQGTLAGKGLSIGGQRLFRNHTFKEPGYLMAIMSVVPKSAYFQGDLREDLYDNCYDFPNPFFDSLGEQEVYSQELSAANALFNSNQPKVFGYNTRYYEMKQIPDSVHGAFKDSLMYWHEGRHFTEGTSSSDVINLNKNFVKMQASEVNRIFPSSESSDKLLGEFFFDIKAKRSLSYYGVPRVGHK